MSGEMLHVSKKLWSLRRLLNLASLLLHNSNTDFTVIIIQLEERIPTPSRPFLLSPLCDANSLIEKSQRKPLQASAVNQQLNPQLCCKRYKTPDLSWLCLQREEQGSTNTHINIPVKRKQTRLMRKMDPFHPLSKGAAVKATSLCSF